MEPCLDQNDLLWWKMPHCCLFSAFHCRIFLCRNSGKAQTQSAGLCVPSTFAQRNTAYYGSWLTSKTRGKSHRCALVAIRVSGSPVTPLRMKGLKPIGQGGPFGSTHTLTLTCFAQHIQHSFGTSLRPRIATSHQG